MVWNVYARGPEDSGIVFSGRLTASDGGYATQADVTSVTRYIVDANEASVIDTEVLDKTAVVFDSLSTSAPWDSTIDSTGWNFQDKISGTKFPSANADQGVKMQTYIVEYRFVMADGLDFTARACEYETVKAYGS